MPHMKSESELIPFAPGRLDGSPLLALAPHPDDEIFGCGGALAQAAAAGAEICVVIVTDGAAQGEAAARRAESLEAAKRLGLPEPRLWDLADRSLAPDDDDLRERLYTLLLEVKPRMILVPSPAELHPDHRALTLAVYRLLQQAMPGSELHEAVQSSRLAAYEVSAVLRPNLLIDVTHEWDEVVSAAQAFESQLQQLPYLEVLQGTASTRRLTLPTPVKWAEAYHVVDLRYVRNHSASEWAAAQGPSTELEDIGNAANLDVVIRTRNRPHLLNDALASVLAQACLPARILVVNDGGAAVDEICAQADERCQLDLIQLDSSGGRSAAAQLGLERATASHVVFLDDDDLFFPEHLLVLGRAVARGITVPYTDAVQGIWKSGESDGKLEPVARHRTFGGGFDPARFKLVNHIPLPCVAIPRELALKVGGFNAKLDLYEDWDLLLRLADQTPLVHLPVLTCEYRVIPEAGGITGSNPPGSKGQLAALSATWKRHGLTRRPRQLAAAVMALIAERDRVGELARNLDEQLIMARGESEGLRGQLERHRADMDRFRQVSDKLDQLKKTLEEQYNTEVKLRAEINRLNGLLETIYTSRTWKLHLAVEKLRRRK
jgi:LmbE family N-acetylglucosaminyl deacetylase/glycosyltransferase involved in cell wall biosynthesis